MTRREWLAQFPIHRREDIMLAISYSAFMGRASIARHVEARGGEWREVVAR